MIKDYGEIEKHEFAGKYEGMYKFIYPLMCPVYLAENNLWDDDISDDLQSTQLEIEWD